MCIQVNAAIESPTLVRFYYDCLDIEKRLFFLMAQEPTLGQGLFIFELSRLHSDTPHSVGLTLTSDQPDS
jgi:hypothetical protein